MYIIIFTSRYILNTSLFSLDTRYQTQYFPPWDFTNVNGHITVKRSYAASLTILWHHKGPRQGLSKVPKFQTCYLICQYMPHVSYINSSWQAVSMYYPGITHAATPVASSKAQWKLKLVTLGPRTWVKHQWDHMKHPWQRWHWNNLHMC